MWKIDVSAGNNVSKHAIGKILYIVILKINLYLYVKSTSNRALLNNYNAYYTCIGGVVLCPMYYFELRIPNANYRVLWWSCILQMESSHYDFIVDYDLFRIEL